MPQKGRNEFVGGLFIDLARLALLYDPAIPHNGDARRHRQSFFLIMGHINRGQAEISLQLEKFETHFYAKFGVEVAERLVKKQRSRLNYQCARQRDPLLLPARKLRWTSFFGSRKINLLESRRNSALDLAAFYLSFSQTEGDVLENTQVRPQCVVLKNQADVPAPGRHVIHRLVIQINHALVRCNKSRNDPQQGGFTAAAGSQEGEELSLFDIEANVANHPVIAVTFSDTLQPDTSRLHVKYERRYLRARRRFGASDKFR